MEEQAVEKKTKFKVLFRKELVIDYDQLISEICLPKKVREVHKDVPKIRIKKTGKKLVKLVLIDLGPSVCHYRAEKEMTKEGIEQAGIHEIFYFIEFLPELTETKMFVSSLREGTRFGVLELIPTICVYGKNSIFISLAPKDDLPLYRTYFLGIEN